VSLAARKTKSGEYPVIDLERKALLALFENMPAIRLVQRDGKIHLLPLATELRKRERLTRLKDKVLSDKPLDVGGTSYGAGVLAHALDDGLNESGVATHQRFANEISPELLQHALTFRLRDPIKQWSLLRRCKNLHLMKLPASTSRALAFEAGLPCPGASSAGGARRKTSKAEEHPKVGHLVVAALVIISKQTQP
jgi:DNA (cytosine-5)-methyltransferase 1